MKKTIITHSGSFHNDEVLATAIIELAFPKDSFYIVRTRDSEVIAQGKIDEETFVIDVGGEYIPESNVFDHHQSGWTWPFGPDFQRTVTASCGQVWGKFGKKVCGNDETLCNAVYASLIEEIDRQDNGMDPIGRGPKFQITIFNPSWSDNSNGDEEFLDAVEIAIKFLVTTINRESALINAAYLHDDTVKSQESKSGVFILDDYYPWVQYLGSDHDYTFVVYPRKDGDWAIQTIPTGVGFENKGSLPQTWIDSPVKDMIFCHKARFIASFTTRERAIEMAKEAIALL